MELIITLSMSGPAVKPAALINPLLFTPQERSGPLPVRESPVAPMGVRNRLIKSDSIHDIWERSFKIIRGTKVIVDQAKKVKMMLGSSKGRDKICSIIQYTAKLVYTCNVYSNIPSIQNYLK